MAFDADLTLLYQFDVDKALTPVNSLGPTLGITRTTDATYFDSSGVLQTASTGVPRFDHNPTTPFASLGLFVEEARTNSIVRAEEFDEGSWSRAAEITITANDTAAPDGNTTAEKITTTAVAFKPISQIGITVADASSYTVSVFVKDVDLDEVTVRVISGTTDNAIIVTISTQTITSGTGTAVDIGDGWIRISLTVTTDGTSLDCHIYPGDQNDAIAGSVYLWGAQLELGASLTSYIKTVASAVTRNADVVSTTTLSWLDTAATAVGTYYVRGQFPIADAVANALLTLDDGGTTDRFYFERDAAENINFATTHSSDIDGLVSGVAVIAAKTEFELGASYIDDDVVMAVDNTLETADTTAAIPLGDNPTTLRVGADSAGNYWNGHIAELRYYDVQKNDTFVQQLSNGEIEESPSGGVRLTKFTFRMGFRM